jgi:hypothetical protein
MTTETDRGFALNFDKTPPQRCIHCNRPRMHHKAETYHCPGGTPGVRHRAGTVSWWESTVFEPKPASRAAAALAKE